MADMPGFDLRRTASQQYKNEELHIPSYAAPGGGRRGSSSNPSEGPSRSTSHLYSVPEASSVSPARYSYYADLPSESNYLPQTSSGFQHDAGRRYSSTADADTTGPIPGLLQPGRHSNDFGPHSANLVGVGGGGGGEGFNSRPTSTTTTTGAGAAPTSTNMYQDASHTRPPSLSIGTGPGPVDSFHHYLPADPTAPQRQSFPGRPPAITPQGSGMKSMAGPPGSIAPYSMGHASQPSVGSAHQSPLGLADIRQDMPAGEEPASADSAELPSTWNSNYLSPWPLYALDWCKWPNTDGTFGKVAAASYLEDNHNYLSIFDTYESPYDAHLPDSERGLEFRKIAEASHSYPVTRVLWEPPTTMKESTDLLATSGDHLRLWSVPKEQMSYYSNSLHSQTTATPAKLSPLALLSNSKSPEHTAPITSLDWNVREPSLIITSSIDTTCTIWDIPSLTAKTQLIAHDKEVFDVRFCANSVDAFVSCGADGSVRMFDLRSLDHSTIIYEPNEKSDRLSNPGDLSPPGASLWPPPLLRIATSPHDAFLLATFAQDSNIIRILDTRQPGQALVELKGHSASVNCIEWSPFRRGTLASGADDSLVCIWDLFDPKTNTVVQSSQHQGPGHGPAGATTTERAPVAAWRSDFEVSNISWSPHMPSQGSRSGRGWLGVCSGRVLTGVAI